MNYVNPLTARYLGDTGLSPSGGVLTDAEGVAGTTIATGIAAASTVSSLLVAAGASSAMVPYGWIVAGGLALAAGTIATVDAVRTAKLKRADIVDQAKKLGIPNADAFPSFVARAMNMLYVDGDVSKYKDLMAKYGDKADKDKSKGKTGTNDQGKAAILATVWAFHVAEQRGTVSPPAPPETVAIEYDDGATPDSDLEPGIDAGTVVLYVAGAVAALAALAVVVKLARGR